MGFRRFGDLEASVHELRGIPQKILIWSAKVESCVGFDLKIVGFERRIEQKSKFEMFGR